MSDWLIAVDSSKYDDIEKLNKIEWNEANKDEINQGDTVYLHIAKKMYHQYSSVRLIQQRALWSLNYWTHSPAQCTQKRISWKNLDFRKIR